MGGKHRKDLEMPSTGNGKKGGRKPARTQVAISTPGGATFWKQTASLFSRKGGKK